MTDYSELVKALRDCADTCNIIDECEFVCPYNNELPRCVDKMMQDAAAAIEGLQDEVKRLEPKRGEYIWIQKENGGQYKGCSICHAPIPTDSMLDYLDDEDCEFCYSCGAKMEVQDATES